MRENCFFGIFSVFNFLKNFRVVDWGAWPPVRDAPTHGQTDGRTDGRMHEQTGSIKLPATVRGADTSRESADELKNTLSIDVLHQDNRLSSDA